MGDGVNDPTNVIEDRELITDLARYSEEILSEQQLRRKYRHLTNDDWDRLGTDEELITSIELTKLSRIRSGAVTRERAQLLHTKAPDVLSEIMTGDGVSHRAKIESAKALGQIAAPAPELAPAANAEKFSIVINMGGNPPEIIHVDKPLKIGPSDDIKHIVDVDDVDDEYASSPWGLIAATKLKDDGNGGQSHL